MTSANGIKGLVGVSEGCMHAGYIQNLSVKKRKVKNQKKEVKKKGETKKWKEY